MERYTVMTIIIGDYEVVHEITEKSHNARYLLITDRPDLNSTTWEVIYDADLKGGPFNKVMDIRWHPWRYTDDEVVINIDGSVGIDKSLDEIVQKFEIEQCAVSLMVHPHRSTAEEELAAWIKLRGYSMDAATRQLNIMKAAGYDTSSYRGLYQMNWMIRRRTPEVRQWMETICGVLMLAGQGEYDRLDQILASFVFNMWFNNLKVLWVSGHLVSSQYLTWFKHGSFQPNKQGAFIDSYALNQRVDTWI